MTLRRIISDEALAAFARFWSITDPDHASAGHKHLRRLGFVVANQRWSDAWLAAIQVPSKRRRTAVAK